MPQRVARRKVSRTRLGALFTAVAVAGIAAASYHGVTVLAMLRDGAWRYSRDARVEGTYAGGTGARPLSAVQDPVYLQSEREWLLQSQMPNGAIAQTPSQDLVVPYFANLAAKTLVDIEPQRARKYIEWYIVNMNRPDRSGLSGTIYDFEKRGGELVPTYKYDSADSYAATFLSLVSYYFSKTGDSEFVMSNLSSVDLAAQAILELQDTDGLVRVMAGSRTKYLMDNSECYRGLLDWAEALAALGEETLAGEYVAAAERISRGIDEVLYDAKKEAYAWSVSWLGKRFPREGRWYPDAVSQTALISCGVIDADSPRAARIWAKLNEQFPLWEQGVTGDTFPWAKIALTATIMDDAERAERFVTWARDEFAASGRSYPWYVMESAGTLDAVAAILGKAP